VELFEEEEPGASGLAALARGTSGERGPGGGPGQCDTGAQQHAVLLWDHHPGEGGGRGQAGLPQQQGRAE